ncbi:MAG: hypothetical protein AAB837_01485 [Patescibacteria group bacterium]
MISLEPTLSKIPKKSIRSAPPPAADYGGLPRRKIFSTFFILRAPVFSSKRKRKFFCFGFRAQSAGRRGFASARGQKGRGLGGRNFCPLARSFWRPATNYQSPP